MIRFAAPLIVLLASLAPSAQAKPELAHVEVRGSGDTALVLIPGLVCGWEVWETFMERNADRYTMYAVTLPGMNGTEPLPTPESVEGTPWLDGCAEAIVAMIEARGLEEPIIVGHSMGGTLAFRMAAEHGDVIGGAVSVDGMAAFPMGPTPIEETQRVEMVNKNIAPVMLNAPEEQWYGQFNDLGPIQMTDQELYKTWKEHFRKTKARVGQRFMVELMKTDASDDLANAEDPILVLPAENGPQTQYLGGEEAVKKLWDSQIEHAPKALVTMTFAPDCRHFVFFDKPEWFDVRVAEFVERVEGGD